MDTLDKILYLLKTNNIEQQKFAEDIGLKKQAISEWKSGKTKSYKKYIDKIAEYFNVSTDYLLGIEIKDQDDDDNLNPIQKEMMELIKDASDEDLLLMKQILEKFDKK